MSDINVNDPTRRDKAIPDDYDDPTPFPVRAVEKPGRAVPYRGPATWAALHDEETIAMPSDHRADAVAKCREIMANPLGIGLRFAVARNGSAIGVWQEEQGRFIEVFMRLITGDWLDIVEAGGVIRTSLCNSKPLYGPEDWEEVA